MSTQTHQQKNGGRHTLRKSIIHEDSRTQRERERGDRERKAVEYALESELEETDHILEQNMEALSNYTQQGGE